MNPPPSTPPADPDQFRALMGCFATGIAVATTLDENRKPVGMTASAVASVSLDPPLLLICVSRDAKFHTALEAGGCFVLNVLADDQENLSRDFAGAVENPFATRAYEPGPDGVPRLTGVVAHIVCNRSTAFEAGDHTVFFGTVTAGEIFDREPLLHYRSGYRKTKPGA